MNKLYFVLKNGDENVFYNTEDISQYCKEVYDISVSKELVDGVNIIDTHLSIFVFDPMKIYNLSDLNIDNIENGKVIKLNGWLLLFVDDIFNVYRIIKISNKPEFKFVKLSYGRDGSRKRLRINGTRYSVRYLNSILN